LDLFVAVLVFVMKLVPASLKALDVFVEVLVFAIIGWLVNIVDMFVEVLLFVEAATSSFIELDVLLEVLMFTE